MQIELGRETGHKNYVQIAVATLPGEPVDDDGVHLDDKDDALTGSPTPEEIIDYLLHFGFGTAGLLRLL